MPNAQIYFDDSEDRIIRKFSAEWNLSKYETVKRIIKEYEKMKGGNKDAVI